MQILGIILFSGIVYFVSSMFLYYFVLSWFFNGLAHYGKVAEKVRKEK